MFSAYLNFLLICVLLADIDVVCWAAFYAVCILDIRWNIKLKSCQQWKARISGVFRDWSMAILQSWSAWDRQSPRKVYFSDHCGLLKQDSFCLWLTRLSTTVTALTDTVVMLIFCHYWGNNGLKDVLSANSCVKSLSLHSVVQSSASVVRWSQRFGHTKDENCGFTKLLSWSISRRSWKIHQWLLDSSLAAS